MAASGADMRLRITRLADQCVKCGLCLPVCPTYAVGRSEAESPRGRIAFAHALAAGQMAATLTMTAHLDHCLVCQSCEIVCPSKVGFGELIVATRALLHESAVAPRSLAEKLLRHPRWLQVLLRIGTLPVLRDVLRSRAAGALLRPFGLGRWLRELPDIPPVGEAAVGARERRGRIGLFRGCVASIADRDVHAGARRLLAALGYEVIVPSCVCCGASALHAGDIGAADRLAAPTRRAFEAAGIDTMLVSASGCFGALRDRTFRGSSVRVREIHEFLAAEKRFADLMFKPLPRRAALHTPCTQANVARGGTAVRALLGRIPDLDVAAIEGAPGCCGAAGDYFLRHAEIADTLRTGTLDKTLAQSPDLLISSNVGCRIFLDNGLRQRGVAMRVTHPVVLLARQLEN
jgi:glycolate oxidase iron-sulfur subunit